MARRLLSPVGMKTTTQTTGANVENLGDSMGARCVRGSRIEVKRYIYSLGLELGEQQRKIIDVVDRANVYGDLTDHYHLKDVDGEYAGLFMASDLHGNWCAVVHLKYI